MLMKKFLPVNTVTALLHKFLLKVLVILLLENLILLKLGNILNVI